jgi:hypothetical protein
MATGNTDDGLFNLPYPLAEDPVNVHGDIEALADRLKIILPPLGLSQFQIQVKNTGGSTLAAGTPVYVTGYTTVTTVSKAISTTSPILGLLKTSLANNAEGIAVVAGVMEDINTSGFSAGDVLYVAETGGLTATRPAAGSGAVGIVAHAASDGIIIVEAKGNGTWGALKAGLA